MPTNTEYLRDYRKVHWEIWGAAAAMLVKVLFLFTHHIQEDAFITWRVAQNLLDYGVIGFNGPIKISASTTHLYVFLSYLYTVVFGKEHFIYPLLISNSLLFTVGSYWLGKMLRLEGWRLGVFIFIFGILPASIKIGILGMEYGLLFFLEMAFLYFGMVKNKSWAKLLLPFLILFTRIDTVIFLGIAFMFHLFYNKKWDWKIIIGGLLGLLTCIAFNYLYFGEIVNNTIVAKQNAYKILENVSLSERINEFLYYVPHFGGMLKLPGSNPVFWIILLFEILAFIICITYEEKETKKYLSILFGFGIVKSCLFLSQRSYFDWYYWVPQLCLFLPILLLLLRQKISKISRWYWFSFGLFYILPLLIFQTIHSIATGNGEWNYRRSIGLYLNSIEPDKTQWIFLEPAGYVPYFSGLKTIDEVGLVDKPIQKVIHDNPANFRFIIAKTRKPKYILAYFPLPNDNSQEGIFYKSHYSLIKKFRINEHLSHSNPLIQKIYSLKPSGTDYNLYQKIQ